MKPEDYAPNEAWVVYSPAYLPEHLKAQPSRAYFVIDAATKEIIGSDACPGLPGALTEEDAADFLKKVLMNQPEAIRQALPINIHVCVSDDRDARALSEAMSSAWQRWPTRSTQAFLEYIIDDVRESFRTMIDQEFGEDDDQIGDEDEGEDDFDPHDSIAGAFDSSQELRDAIIDRLSALSDLVDDGGDRSNIDYHDLYHKPIFAAINGKDGHYCVDCAAAALGCTPFDLVVMLGFNPTPNSFLEFVEKIGPGDDLAGYGVAGLAASLFGLARTDLLDRVPPHQLPALHLIIDAFRRLVSRIEADNSQPIDQRIRRTMNGAKVLVAIEDGGPIGELLQSFSSLDIMRICRATASLDHCAQSASDVLETAADEFTEMLRDTTAALPFAPDAERTALHITEFTAKLKNQLSFNKPSIRFNQFFDSVIQQGFHSPTASLRDFLDEIEDLGEDLCSD